MNIIKLFIITWISFLAFSGELLLTEEFFELSNVEKQICQLSTDISIKIKIKEFAEKNELQMSDLFPNELTKIVVIIYGLTLIEESFTFNFNNYITTQTRLMFYIENRISHDEDIISIAIPLEGKAYYNAKAPPKIKFDFVNTRDYVVLLESQIKVQKHFFNPSSFGMVDVVKGLEEGCYKWEVFLDCYKVPTDTKIVMKAVYNDKSEDYINNPFKHVPKQCIFLEDEKKLDKECITGQNSIMVEGMFSEEPEHDNHTFTLCNVLSIPGIVYSLEFQFLSKFDVVYKSFSNNFLNFTPFVFRTESLTSDVLKSDKEFEFEVFLSHKVEFEFIAEMRIEIIVPKELSAVREMNVVVKNMGGDTRSFDQVKQQSGFKFVIDLNEFHINTLKGLKIFINGFTTPNNIGQYELQFDIKNRLRDENIAETVKIPFSISPNIENDFEISLSQRDLGESTNIKVRAVIPYFDKSGENDLIFNLGNGLEFIKNAPMKVSFKTNQEYKEIEKDEVNKKIIVKDLILEFQNEFGSYIEFDIANLKNNSVNAFNLFVGLQLKEFETTMWENEFTYDLNYVKFNVVKKSLEINNQAFIFNIDFNYEGRINFDHYLRLNLPESFLITFNSNCVFASSLPATTDDFVCLSTKKHENDKLFNRQNVLIKNALNNSESNKEYSISIFGSLANFVNFFETVNLDIIFDREGELPINSKVSKSVLTTFYFNCPTNCAKCDTSSESEMRCEGCADGYIVDKEKNICRIRTKEDEPVDEPKETNEDVSSPVDQEPKPVDPELQIAYREKIEKIFSSFLLSFIIIGFTIVVYLKNIFHQNFEILFFCAIMFTACQSFSNYIVLAYSWDIGASKVEVSLLNITILLYWILNLFTSLYIVTKKNNKLLKNTKIVGIRSNNLFFVALYAFFGSGCLLWIEAFRFVDIYSKLYVPKSQMEDLRNIIKLTIYMNLFFSLFLTVSVVAVLFIFDTFNLLKLFYLLTGIATASFYLVLLFKKKDGMNNNDLEFVESDRVSKFEASLMFKFGDDLVRNNDPILLEGSISMELNNINDDELHGDLKIWMNNINTLKV